MALSPANPLTCPRESGTISFMAHGAWRMAHGAWRMAHGVAVFVILFFFAACNSNLKVITSAAPSAKLGQENPDSQSDAVNNDDTSSQGNDPTTADNDQAPAKLADPNCVDPDLSRIPNDVNLTMCDGTLAVGTLVLPAPCLADGDGNCVLIGPKFKATNLDNFSNTDIRLGASVAGISGSYIGSSTLCANDGDASCLVDGTNFKAAKLSNYAASDIKSGVTIAGISGNATLETHSSCSADGSVGCVVVGPTYAAALVSGAAAKILTGQSLAGVSGTAPVRPSDCSADGATSCVAVSNFPAVDKVTKLTPANIKKNVVIAGVTGDYPSATNPLTGADATVDLPVFSSTTGGSTYEWFSSDGNRLTGTIEANASATASTSGQVLNAGLYRQVTVTGDADLVAANIASGINIFGTVGSATLESHSNCAADGVTGCVTNATYPSALITGLAPKIVSGNTVAGVAGTTVAESHGNCATDGEAGCVVVGPAFKAADTSLAVAANIKSGVTVAGTLGSYGPACNADGGDSCLVDGTNYKAAKLSNFIGADVKSGVTIAGVPGSATLEGHSDCAADGGTGCVATATYTAALTTNLGNKVLSGQTVAGVAGNVTLPAVGDVESGVTYGIGGTGSTGTFAVPAQANVASGTNYGAGGTEFNGSATIESHSNCVADGGTGCVATATYTAALTTGLAAKVVSGNTVAGIPGSATAESHSSCTAANQSGCVATATYKTLDLSTAGAGTGITNANFNATIKAVGNFEFWDAAGAKHTVAGDTDLAAANIANSIDIFGTTGTATLESHSSCTADNQTGCVTTATYKSADTTAITTGDLKSGKTIAGIAGALANCAADGEAGCVVVGPAFKAADMSVATVGNIKSGVTIAGVAGQYPSATYTLPGASGTTDLTSMAATAAAGSYEFWDSAGARYTGAITDASTITPGTSDQTFNASLYRQFTVSGDADLVAGKIKSGVNLFGVSGDYPSATYPLPSASATADLDNATFNAKVKSSTAFEYWTSDGSYQTGAGDDDIVAANIVSGISIFGTSGSAVSGSDCTGDGQTGCVTTSTYKSADTSAYSTWDIRKGKTVGGKAGDLVFYKNMIGAYNNSTAPAVAGNDVWDTVDDYNNNGAFPTTAPSGWDQATGANWVMDSTNDTGVGAGTASDGLCNGTEACVFKDQITNLMWAKDQGSYTWQNGITQCDNLNYGGYTDWRLPTQKELMQVYTDGIWSQKASTKLSLTANYYWASSTVSDTTTGAWVVNPIDGVTNSNAKTSTYRVVCVR